MASPLLQQQGSSFSSGPPSKPMHLLRQVLKELCTEGEWTYALFWRLKRRVVPRSTAGGGQPRTTRILRRPEDDDW